jgi:hypothetical protein
LLRAVAFCVTGTFRKVGPAYVLTDDVAGAGARKAMIADAKKLAQYGRDDAVLRAGHTLSVRHALRDLSFFEDPLALTPEQSARMAAAAGSEENRFSPMAAAMPMEQLTPNQRLAALKIFQDRWKAIKDSPNPGKAQPQLTGDIKLTPKPSLCVLSPEVDGPMVYDAVDVAGMFYRNSAEGDTKAGMERAAGIWTKWAARPVPPLPDAVGKFPTRAIFARPETTTELDDVMDAMGALGFNELWLDVFSDGRVHVMADPADDLAHNLSLDLLSLAVKRAKDRGISVLPVFSLLRWGGQAPKSAFDMDILGETTSGYSRLMASAPPAEPTEPWMVRETQREVDMLAPLLDDWVSPSASVTADALKAAVADAAGHTGIAGMVWQDVAENPDLPGYALATGQPAFGYAPDDRLAFLRKEHVDPIDIDETQDMRLPLPELDGGAKGADIDQRLAGLWNEFRQKATRDLLTGLAGVLDGATGSGAAPLPIYIRQKDSPSLSGTTYVAWTDRAAPIPGVGASDLPRTLPPPGVTPPAGPPAKPVVNLPAMVTQLPILYNEVPEYDLSKIPTRPEWSKVNGVASCYWLQQLDREAPLTARRIEDAAQTFVPPGSHGFLLDLTPESGLEAESRQFVLLAAAH